MKLSVSKALRKGVEAQPAVEAQEVWRYYAAILKSFAILYLILLKLSLGKKKEYFLRMDFTY